MTGMLVISLRGVKSQILVSLRVFGTESTIFVHTGVARAVNKEIYKKKIQ